jgi:Icc-related predicted phosphoesterase
MKILFAADLHGETQLYHELFDLIQGASSEILTLGGDLLPSFAPSKKYEDMIPNQKTFIDQHLLPWVQTLIQKTGVRRIFLIPGNWDLGYPYLLRNAPESLVDLSQKVYRLPDGYEWVGYPFVPPTPFRPKTYERMDDRESPWPPQKNPSYVRLAEQDDQVTAIDPFVYFRQKRTIEEDLQRLASPADQKKAIYVMHSPPYGTRLDLTHEGHHVGSKAIRTFVERNQPLLTLHGHIHESPEVSGSFVDKIGETFSVNPGQFTSRRRDRFELHAVTFELERLGGTLSHTCL